VGATITRALSRRQPLVSKDWNPGDASAPVPSYLAVLPLYSGATATGALVITGDERDPLTALDDSFLLALGQHVGAALERSELLRRLAERTRELERLSVRVLRQHEAERRKISLELHDETAQLLAAVKMQVGLLQETSDAELRARLDRVLGLIDAGIRSIRRLSFELRPPLLDDVGFLPALRALVEDFSQRTDLAVTLDAPVSALPLSDEAEVALFRALQEALSNVARHARATRIDVSIVVDDRMVQLRVRDNGRGLTTALDENGSESGHAGLAGMRERVGALGGKVTVRPGEGAGVEVEVRVPQAARASDASALQVAT
jgi:signal transduction histidine kinase